MSYLTQIFVLQDLKSILQVLKCTYQDLQRTLQVLQYKILLVPAT